MKSLENESHTELSCEDIKDQNMQKNAKRFINNLSREMSKIIEEYIRMNNPTDGAMNTDDVLYDIENKFREELANSSSNVKIGKGSNEKVITKAKQKVSKDPKKKREKQESKKGIKEVKRKNKNKEDKGYFSIRPNLVRRAIVTNRETLSIDLSNEKNMVNINSCDLYIGLVDGMGKEYMNEFDIVESYSSITDKRSGMSINSSKTLLKQVPINGGKIELLLELNKSFNKTLKFVYYLEV